MCSIYVFGRNSKFDTTFKDIMTSYRKQPQSTSDVYRDVHMSTSGECKNCLIISSPAYTSFISDYEREGNSTEDNDATSRFLGTP